MTRKYLKLAAIPAFIAVALIIISLLNAYSHTKTERLYLTPKIYDNVGWEIYTIDDGKHKLTTSGNIINEGGMTGTTIYLSRILTEDIWESGYNFLVLDKFRPIAVFLDGELLYTNCPEAKPEPDKTTFPEEFEVSGEERDYLRCTLPDDFVGKRLLIATANPAGVNFPAGIILSSTRIEAETLRAALNKKMMPATAFAMIGLTMLGIWLYAFLQHMYTIPSLLLIALAFLQALYRLMEYEHISPVETPLDSPLTSFIPVLGILIPMLYFLLKMKNKRNKIIFGCIFGIAAVVSLIMPVMGLLGNHTFYNGFLYYNKIFYVAVIAMPVFAAMESKNNKELRLFLIGFGILIILVALLYFTSLAGDGDYAEKIGSVLSFALNGRPGELFNWCANGLFLISASIGFYTLIYNTIKIQTDLAVQNERAAQLEKSLTYQKQFYEAKLSQENEILALNHDMNGHLKTTMTLLFNNMVDEAIEYISEISEQRSENTKEIFCQNPYMNAVLSNYSARCKENDISFQCHIGVDDFTLPSTEICLILNNALENAVDASLSIEEGREIKVQSAVQQDRFLLRVSNRFDGKLNEGEGIPRTTKKGKEHGYGMSNIRQAAEKMGGSMEYHIDGSYFVLDVEFPVRKKRLLWQTELDYTEAED